MRVTSDNNNDNNNNDDDDNNCNDKKNYDNNNYYFQYLREPDRVRQYYFIVRGQCIQFISSKHCWDFFLIFYNVSFDIFFR